MKHINTQKTEADDLRQKLSSAAKEALRVEADVERRLEICLQEERQQAALDRQTLLSQIVELVNRTGAAQDTRLESKISGVRNEISYSRSKFEAERKQYGENMDIWSQKENFLVEEILESTNGLKGKIKNDWSVSRPVQSKTALTMSNYLLPFRQYTNGTQLSRRPPSPSMKKPSASSTLR